MQNRVRPGCRRAGAGRAVLGNPMTLSGEWIGRQGNARVMVVGEQLLVPETVTLHVQVGDGGQVFQQGPWLDRRTALLDAFIAVAAQRSLLAPVFLAQLGDVHLHGLAALQPLPQAAEQLLPVAHHAGQAMLEVLASHQQRETDVAAVDGSRCRQWRTSRSTCWRNCSALRADSTIR